MKPHASTETIERLIVGKVVEGLLIAGFGLSAETGNQEPLLDFCNDNAGPILAAIFVCDEEEVWLFTDDRKRFVKLVLGNGVDVISDYHIDLEGPLAKANALAIALEG